uniref:Uncharacterized protein n=2 Tax=Chrysotila carterae TaxID=13221 RepID=A0A7S4BH76_CHRCT
MPPMRVGGAVSEGNSVPVARGIPLAQPQRPLSDRATSRPPATMPIAQAVHQKYCGESSSPSCGYMDEVETSSGAEGGRAKRSWMPRLPTWKASTSSARPAWGREE